MTGPRAGRTRRFRAARGGNVAILVALGSAMLMGAGAVGIDLGMVFQARRKAQGAVDIAAMLAAVDPAQADTAARRSLGDNGYATATATVSPGRYDASAPGTAPGSRFKAGGSPANAVRVGLSTSVPVTFGRAIGLPAAVPLRVTGTAASAQFAAFTIGSGTLQLQGGIANALLGALMGAKLSLSVSDYDALASARVDGLRVLDALGASLNMQAANYTDIVQAQASVGQMLMALRVAAQDNGSVVSALSGILNALPNAGNLIAIGQVDGLGDAAALAPPRGFAGPSLNVLNLLGAAAALANGQNQVAVDLGATIPGLLATRLTLAIGERKRSSGWVRPGSPNATVQTAQTRLLIEATVTAPLGLGSLTLPVYAEVAPAQATLRALTCAGPSGRQVTLDAQTGLATLAIAGVPRTAINGGSTGPDLSQPAPDRPAADHRLRPRAGDTGYGRADPDLLGGGHRQPHRALGRVGQPDPVADRQPAAQPHAEHQRDRRGSAAPVGPDDDPGRRGARDRPRARQRAAQPRPAPRLRRSRCRRHPLQPGRSGAVSRAGPAQWPRPRAPVVEALAMCRPRCSSSMSTRS